MHDPYVIYGEPDLKLGGLSIWALSREFPDSADCWDANWIIVHIRVQTESGIADNQGPWLRSDEISDFSMQLEAVRRSLEGTAHLNCIEPILAAKVTARSVRTMDVVVDFVPQSDLASQTFRFFAEHSEIGRFLSQCRALLERYPVIGVRHL